MRCLHKVHFLYLNVCMWTSRKGIHGHIIFILLVVLPVSCLYQVCQKIGLSGEETQSLMSKIGDQEIKDKLKETTQKALDMGVGRCVLTTRICEP